MTTTTAEFITLGKRFTKDSFVGMADVQKSPKESLQGFRLIMNGSKPQGIYMDIVIWNEIAQKMEEKGFNTSL